MNAELQRVFELLERGLRVRDCWMLTLHIDPRFRSLQGDERLTKLLDSVGVPPGARER